MSTSTPDGMKPADHETDGQPRPMNASMPRHYAVAADMMARPLVGAAAISALSLGMASQAFGIWLGAFAGSMDATRRLFELDVPARGPAPRLEDGPSFPAQRKSPAESAMAAVETLMADAGAAADRATSATVARAERLAPPVITRARPARSPRAPAVPAATKPAEALMPEDFITPTAIKKPRKPDDLKAILGIGPKLEQVLNGLGVWTYAQVAAWSPAEIAWVDDYLSFKGRIGRDGWVAQAAALGAPKAKR